MREVRVRKGANSGRPAVQKSSKRNAAASSRLITRHSGKAIEATHDELSRESENYHDQIADFYLVEIAVAVRRLYAITRFIALTSGARSGINDPAITKGAFNARRAIGGGNGESAPMIQIALRLLPRLPLFLVDAVATHLVMSFSQTVLHYKLGHHPAGRKFFRNHINFHHVYYCKDHLVSVTYRGDEGNNTPFFFIPVVLVGVCTYLVLPLDLFMVTGLACAASFYVHVVFDKEYHVDGSWLHRFAWFRRKQELHFVHHRHANSNFGVVHFFWDRALGTYRGPDIREL
jgi:hypothetical protein